MRKYLLLLTLLVASNFIYGQATIDKETRENIDKLVQNYKPIDSTKILRKLDSIYLNTTVASNKSYALFALAITYHLSDNKRKYSDFLLKSESEAQKNKDYYTLIDVYDAMAHNYTELKLYSQALQYNKQTIAYIQKIDNNKEFITVAKLRQIDILLKMNNFKDLPPIFDELNMLFKKAPLNVSLVSNKSKLLHLQGTYYIKLKRFDDALKYLYEYLEFIDTNKHIVDIGYDRAVVNAKIGLCMVYLDRFDEAKEQINIVKNLVNESSIVEMFNYYFLLHEYYVKIEDTENTLIYRKKIDALRNKYSQLNTKVVDEHLINQMQQAEPSTSWYIILINFFGLCLIIDLIYTTVSRFFNKSNISNEAIPYVVKAIPKTDQNFITGYLIENTDTIKKDSNTIESKFKLSQEIVASILEKLKQFESGTSYLKKNYTISDLSSEIKVNTKYLNYVFKNDLQTDFSTYINNLKIQYILKVLETNAEAKSYKLSFLAELAGFSSHSKFTQVFKQVVGIPPSLYVSKL